MPPTSAKTQCNTEAAIWERIIHPDGKMTVTAARRIVELGFSKSERARMHELATLNHTGALTPEDASEFDNFCRVGTMLSILQSQARRVLKSRRRTS